MSLVPLVRADPCRKPILALIEERPELAHDGISAKKANARLSASGSTLTRDAVYRTMRRLAAEGTLRWSTIASTAESDADR